MLNMAVEHAGARAFHVVGPDIDVDMLRTLTDGDQVLAEINGARLFSNAPVKSVASDHPWTVVSHEPGDKLVLSNPLCANDLTLDYSALLTTTATQPAVFMQTRDDGLPGPLFVILQMIAYRAVETDLIELVEPFDKIALLDLFDDERLKLGLLEEWCQVLATFPENGWRHKSFKRFANRAGVSRDVIKAFREHDWQTLLGLSDDTLVRIGEELHVLPVMMEKNNQRRGWIQHDFSRTTR
jgi:hypothetical protein